MTNNYSIDGAKTGFLNSYEDHEDAKTRVDKAMGGKTGRMPYWFQFSKNARTDKTTSRTYLPINGSTMNRICKRFMDIKRCDFRMSDIEQFNYKMLLPGPCKVNNKVVELFRYLDASSKYIQIQAATDINNRLDKGYNALDEDIVREIEKIMPMEEAYPSVLINLFTDSNANIQSCKQTFWRVFGSYVEKNLDYNLTHSHVCEKCGMRIPDWDTEHACSEDPDCLIRCSDCGKLTPRIGHRQIRCPECAAAYRRISKRELMRKYRIDKDGVKECCGT